MKIQMMKLMLALCSTLILSGCGLTHSVTLGTTSVAHAVFYRSVENLHLQFDPRAAFNQDDNKVTMPTTLRVYQLTERTAFDGADYQTLLTQPEETLKVSQLAEKTVRIIPNEVVTLDMPMDKRAQFVAIVGLFRTPDRVSNTWRLVIPRDALDPDEPRIIEVNNSTLMLRPAK